MMGCGDCREIKPPIPPQPTLNLEALISKPSRIDSNGKPLTSLRWNPTPEQLFALEELYRCGTRTPSAQQIQQIASHLRQFGKIEGKNVFYWFQNHKARERQRRSREIKSIWRGNHWSVGSSRDKTSETGLRRTSQEFRQAKTWMPHLKSSNTLSNQYLQESSSMSTPATAAEFKRFMVFDGVGDFRSKQMSWKSMEALRSSANPNTLLIPSPPIEDETKRGEIQTLELFPLEGGLRKVETAIDSGTDLNSTQFFEFLPLKN